MPRPCKRRRICAMPLCDHFGPAESEAGGSVSMTLDEYETIRLIDLEGMSQEECAAQMKVARTTAQAVYNSARLKLARCVVLKKELFIGGGDYVLCDGETENCGYGHRCRKYGCKNETVRRNDKMKIAVTYENGEVFQHFGHTENFKLYDVENGEIKQEKVVNTEGSGHGALAGFLKENGVEVLICGGIGGGARSALDEAGIKLYGGVSGSADSAVKALLAGELTFDPDVMCSHHGEHHHGECSDHGCGEHHCGK